jgi:hypothetical protein
MNQDIKKTASGDFIVINKTPKKIKFPKLKGEIVLGSSKKLQENKL